MFCWPSICVSVSWSLSRRFLSIRAESWPLWPCCEQAHPISIAPGIYFLEKICCKSAPPFARGCLRGEGGRGGGDRERKGRKIVFSGLFPGEHPGFKPRTCSFQKQLNCPWELCHFCLISHPRMGSSAGSIHQSSHVFFFLCIFFSERAANYHHRERANVVINH